MMTPRRKYYRATTPTRTPISPAQEAQATTLTEPCFILDLSCNACKPLVMRSQYLTI